MSTQISSDQRKKYQVLSYLQLRALVGSIGFVLPVAVIIGHSFQIGHVSFMSSVSQYYHTDMRDFLVGCLSILAAFLLTYRGPEKVDNILATLGAVFAVGTGFIPCSDPYGVPDENNLLMGDFGMFHNISAILLFVVFIIFSLYLFRKTDPNEPPTKSKLQRNKVFLVCGIIMCALLILTIIIFSIKTLPQGLILWTEMGMLFSFGVSWFVKGEMILKDERTKNRAFPQQ